MALDNYANLKQAIEDWTHRNDIDLHAEDCITLAEQYFYTGDEPLRVSELETVDTASISTQSSALPTGFIEFRDVRISYDGTNFAKMVFKDAPDLPLYTTSGRPVYYTVGNTFYLDRTPDQAYTVSRRYFARPTALSDAAPTNTILTNYPSIYLWGGMAAAFSYAREEELFAYYGERLRQAIKQANQAYKLKQLGTQPSITIQGDIP